jgi:hypothetical protein
MRDGRRVLQVTAILSLFLGPVVVIESMHAWQKWRARP